MVIAAVISPLRGLSELSNLGLKLLTESEYQKHYGIPRSTLSDALKSGRVRGAIQREDGAWDIPEGALMNYAPGKLPEKGYPNYETVVFHIIKALNSDRYVDAAILQCTNRFFSDVVSMMLEDGLIAESDVPCDGLTSCGYRLTVKGREAASQKKKGAILDWIKGLKPDALKINLINIGL